MTLALTCVSKLSKLERIKTDLRSLLVANSNKKITVAKLNSLYKNIAEIDIPYRDFNFTSLKEFLQSIPEVLRLRNNKANELCVYSVDSEKTSHIKFLVSKEKWEPESNKSKSKLNCNNRIDPKLLTEILKNSSTSCIEKDDILSKIGNRMGNYSFYTKKNLNSQLNELTHILNHDDDFIYIKKELNENKKNVKEFKNQLCQDGNLENMYIQNECQNKKILKKDSAAILIKESTKIRLQNLIKKHSKGIWCSDLPRVYRKEYGINLEYSDLGFNSIIEFVAALPDIFKIIVPKNARKQMVIDAKIHIDYAENHTKFNLDSLTISANLQASDSAAIPIRLSFDVSRTLFPENVMSFDNTVDYIKIIDLFANSNKYFEVVVSDVHNPSFFWITLYKNKRKIEDLMNQLQEFYMRQNLDKYKIPQILLQPRLHIACTFADLWHRGIIKSIKADEIIIFFYDYGTESTYKLNEIYFLDKRFSVLPAQAIPCALHRVKPMVTKKWTTGVRKKFSKHVLGKRFLAYTTSINEKDKSMVINLVDTSNDKLKTCINQWMVVNNLAEWGEFIYMDDNSFDHQQSLKQNNLNLLSTETLKNVLDIEKGLCNTNSKISKSFSSNSISIDKKLEAVKKFKAKFSDLQYLESVVNPINDTNNQSNFNCSTQNINIFFEEKNENEIEKALNEHNLNECHINSDQTNQKSYKIYNKKCDSIGAFTESACGSLHSTNSSVDDKNSIKFLNFNDKVSESSNQIQQKVDVNNTLLNDKNSKNSNKIVDKDITNVIGELRKLITSTKLY